MRVCTHSEETAYLCFPLRRTQFAHSDSIHLNALATKMQSRDSEVTHAIVSISLICSAVFRRSQERLHFERPAVKE